MKATVISLKEENLSKNITSNEKHMLFCTFQTYRLLLSDTRTNAQSNSHSKLKKYSSLFFKLSHDLEHGSRSSKVIWRCTAQWSFFLACLCFKDLSSIVTQKKTNVTVFIRISSTLETCQFFPLNTRQIHKQHLVHDVGPCM